MNHPESTATVLDQSETILNEPGNYLQNTHLLRALEAGWTTAEDRAFVLPVLAWVNSVLIDGPCKRVLRDEGDNSQSHETALIGVQQSNRYMEAMESLKLVGASRKTVPSFARYFVDSAFALRLTNITDIVSALLSLGVQISAQIITAMELAIEKSSTTPDEKGLSASHKPLKINNDSSRQPWEKLLSLYLEFLADLYAAMRSHRLQTAADRIQSRRSLENVAEPPIAMFPGVGEIMFEEKDERRHIEFTVERYPCTAEVLDPRVVRIPPGKFNNRHKHAHETLFYFVSGHGEILIGEEWVKVKPGDAVFSPRWAIHQTHNTGSEEMVLIAITDYYLTSQVYVGKYDKI